MPPAAAKAGLGWSGGDHGTGVHVRQEQASRLFLKSAGGRAHVWLPGAQGWEAEPYSSVTSSGSTSPRKWALKSSCRQDARTDSCSESKSSWVARQRRACHHQRGPQPGSPGPAPCRRGE